MSYEVAFARAMLAYSCALAAAGFAALRHRQRQPEISGRLAARRSPEQYRAVLGSGVHSAETGQHAGPGEHDRVNAGRGAAACDGMGLHEPPADLLLERLYFDDRSRSALTACLFAAAPAERLCWTVAVVDPALNETPGHVRLVGHYESEIAAIGAADQLADALNACLVPGEAPLTATCLAIEPDSEQASGAGVDPAIPAVPAGQDSPAGPVLPSDPANRGGPTTPAEPGRGMGRVSHAGRRGNVAIT